MSASPKHPQIFGQSLQEQIISQLKQNNLESQKEQTLEFLGYLHSINKPQQKKVDELTNAIQTDILSYINLYKLIQAISQNIISNTEQKCEGLNLGSENQGGKNLLQEEICKNISYLISSFYLNMNQHIVECKKYSQEIMKTIENQSQNQLTTLKEKIKQNYDFLQYSNSQQTKFCGNLLKNSLNNNYKIQIDQFINKNNDFLSGEKSPQSFADKLINMNNNSQEKNVYPDFEIDTPNGINPEINLKEQPNPSYQAQAQPSSFYTYGEQEPESSQNGNNQSVNASNMADNEDIDTRFRNQSLDQYSRSKKLSDGGQPGQGQARNLAISQNFDDNQQNKFKSIFETKLEELNLPQLQANSELLYKLKQSQIMYKTSDITSVDFLNLQNNPSFLSKIAPKLQRMSDSKHIFTTEVYIYAKTSRKKANLIITEAQLILTDSQVTKIIEQQDLLHLNKIYFLEKSTTFLIISFNKKINLIIENFRQIYLLDFLNCMLKIKYDKNLEYDVKEISGFDPKLTHNLYSYNNLYMCGYLEDKDCEILNGKIKLPGFFKKVTTQSVFAILNDNGLLVFSKAGGRDCQFVAVTSDSKVSVIDSKKYGFEIFSKYKKLTSVFYVRSKLELDLWVEKLKQYQKQRSYIENLLTKSSYYKSQKSG